MMAFPSKTGLRKLTLSMLAVTVFILACLCATTPAIRSICFRISPPKTFPFGFASDGNILTVISAFDSFGFFGFRVVFYPVLLNKRNLDSFAFLFYDTSMRKSHDDIHCGYEIRNELNALWPRSIICIEYSRNFIFWSDYTKPMKYFWWRFLDYAVGVFVGGLMVFLVNRFLCH